MYKLKTTPPPVLAAQTTMKKPYAKPDFQVIPLNVESPLLSGSSKQPVETQPIGRGTI